MTAFLDLYQLDLQFVIKKLPWLFIGKKIVEPTVQINQIKLYISLHNIHHSKFIWYEIRFSFLYIDLIANRTKDKVNELYIYILLDMVLSLCVFDYDTFCKSVFPRNYCRRSVLIDQILHSRIMMGGLAE